LEGFDVVAADLGVGTHQLRGAGRGFSFDSDERLDMRFDRSSGPSAYDVVNQTPEAELADIFYNYGEERFSRQIAARLCVRRAERPVETPAELARDRQDRLRPPQPARALLAHPPRHPA